jgi:hypothetical protein
MAHLDSNKEKHVNPFEVETWYKWGVLFLYLEMGIAIAVTIYSLIMAFTGSGGFPGKH